MGKPGFFDLENRYAGLDAQGGSAGGDINAAVPFELFRVKLKTALINGGLRRSQEDRKSAAGRKPWDEVLIFKPAPAKARGAGFAGAAQSVGQGDGVPVDRPNSCCF